jgi:hypothetical protein
MASQNSRLKIIFPVGFHNIPGAPGALPALSPDGDLGASVTALLQAAQASGARLGVVGGAAIIPTVAGGPRQGDTPSSPPSSPRSSTPTSMRWPS